MNRRRKFREGMLAWAKYSVSWGTDPKSGLFCYDKQNVLRDGAPVLVLGTPKRKDFDKDWRIILYRGEQTMLDKMLKSGLVCLYEGEKIIVLQKDLLLRQPKIED
jgi:hypothetical protein